MALLSSSSAFDASVTEPSRPNRIAVVPVGGLRANSPTISSLFGRFGGIGSGLPQATRTHATTNARMDSLYVESLRADGTDRFAKHAAAVAEVLEHVVTRARRRQHDRVAGSAELGRAAYRVVHVARVDHRILHFVRGRGIADQWCGFADQHDAFAHVVERFEHRLVAAAFVDAARDQDERARE